MSASGVGLRPLTAARARWLLVVLHVPMAIVPVWFTMFGAAGDTAKYGFVAVFVGPLMLALQLRHSLTAARDMRPRGWPWTLLALAALSYLPLVLPGWTSTWGGGCNWFPMASVLMLMRGRPRIAVFAALAIFRVAFQYLGWLQFGYAFPAVYGLGALVDPIVLYGAAHLVRVLDELRAARVELAQVAVGRERLRFSRDLHDLLGQSLSAIALKGDLALRLLRREPARARVEVVGLTELARTTLHGMRAVAQGDYVVSLEREASGAAALLAAAGITATVEVNPAGLTASTQELFAWAAREGVTNVLRHSDARTCSITAGLRNGKARLDIVNDGAHPPMAHDGSGIAGLAARAAALSGSVTAERRPGDLFALVVQVPVEGT